MRARKYRQKLKQNPEMYKLHRELEKERHRQYRLNMPEDKRKVGSFKSYERVRKYRAALKKKKGKENAKEKEPPKPQKDKEKEILTRKQAIDIGKSRKQNGKKRA